MATNLTMVRFKGGCGGDTLCWALDNLVNDHSRYNGGAGNITLFTDIFGNAFQMFLDSGHHRYPFSTTSWQTTPDHELRAFVSSRIAPGKHSITKAHYILAPRQWHVFHPCRFLDILPSRENAWHIQALHFHKTAFAPSNLPPVVAARSALVRDFQERNGWVPGCWVMALYDGHDPRDYDLFIKQHTNFNASLEQFSLPSDLVLDGGKFIVDDKLCYLQEAVKLLGFSDIPDHITSVVQNWALNNKSILAAHGLLDHDGLTLDDKRNLLHAAFKSRFDAYLVQ